ncbi:MAG: hypothetical protein WCJ57_00435 [Candidatus Falkowbacteria bacterium]
MNLNTNQNSVAMKTNEDGNKTTTPPITPEEHEQDKKNLPKADFIKQLMLSGTPPEEAEELADEIYGKA